MKMDSWATHLPLLVRCVAETSGAVLELGCGLYSTPVLHALCHNRDLYSVESNTEWVKQFQRYGTGRHRIIHGVAGDLLARPWSVVLVDHAPASARAEAIQKLTSADLIVCHDSEHRLYDYERVLAMFRYRVECRRGAPWTTVVSNTTDLGFLDDLV